MSFRIGDMVPYEQHKKLEEKFAQASNTIRYQAECMTKAKGILDAPVTKNNLTGAIIALESLPDSARENMRRFVVNHIMRSAKSVISYCTMVERKCEKTGRVYSGFNKKYNTFNALSYQFVYETFKEAAIHAPTGGFAGRFRNAQVAFILSQSKNSKSQRRDRWR